MKMESIRDRQRLRELASRWAELASMPVMEERKKLWGRLHGLNMVRPMVLVETTYIEDYVPKDMLACEDEYLRKVERYMLENILHAEEMGDDMVLAKFFRIGWQMEQPSFGMQIVMKESKEHGLAYVFEHIIKDPEDMKRLVNRKFHVDKEKTKLLKDRLENIFGDILPISVGNYSFMDNAGDFGWVGNFFFGLTWQLHRFIGMEEMMYWYYDYPDEMHAFMQYMVDDRLEMFRELEKNACLVSNSDDQLGGPRFYGYCDDMPWFEGTASLNQLWAWCESQESVNISGGMYAEFVLPYLAQLARQFGLIYYGCCEPLHDRISLIEKEISNVRAFSVSPWSNFDMIGELIGKKYVFSRKPSSPPLSGVEPDWVAARKDIQITKKAAQSCNYELLFRDIYDINGNRKRMADWVSLVRAELEI